MASLIFLRQPRQLTYSSIPVSRKLIGVTEDALSGVTSGGRGYITLTPDNFPSTATLSSVLVGPYTYAVEWDTLVGAYFVSDQVGQAYYIAKTAEEDNTTQRFIFKVNPSALSLQMQKSKAAEYNIGGATHQFTGNELHQLTLQGAFPIALAEDRSPVQRIEDSFFYQQFLDFRRWYEDSATSLPTHFTQLLYRAEAYVCRFADFQYAEQADANGLLNYRTNLVVEYISNAAVLQDPFVKRTMLPSTLLPR